MSRVIVARVMMRRLPRIRITQNDRQSSVDWSEHETRGNKRTQTQQSKHEGRNPTGRTTTLRLIRFRFAHTIKMPHHARVIKYDRARNGVARCSMPTPALLLQHNAVSPAGLNPTARPCYEQSDIGAPHG